jgi:chromosome segregation ATPase
MMKSAQITLAQRDLYLIQIQEEIKNKRNYILEKNKELEKKQKINEFLSIVKNDYQQYYNHIIQEKQKQYEAMSILNDYLDDLITTKKVLDEELIKAKRDQKQVLREMDNIRTELDEITKYNQ